MPDKVKNRSWMDVGSGAYRHAAKEAIEEGQAPPPVPASETMDSIDLTQPPVPTDATGVTEGTNAVTFDWETVETPSLYEEWLKNNPEFAMRQQQGMAQTLGYDPTYWMDPKRVARYYNAIKAAPPGAQLPEWLTPEFQTSIEQAYKYFEFRNNGASWTNWKYLNPADQALPLLGSLPAPPNEFLWPGEERFVTQPQPPLAGNVTLEAVITRQAAWGSLPEAQRQAILTAPNFDIQVYDPIVRQQMLADPLFNWEALPAWQQTFYKLTTNPYVMASPMALAGMQVGRVGGPLGMAAGAVLGYGLGVLGGQAYDPTKGPWKQPSVAAGLMKVLNVLSEDVEQAAGYVGQVLDAGIAGMQGNVQAEAAARKMLFDPVTREATWQAGRLTYEYGDLGGRLFTNLLQMLEGGQLAESGEDFILGKAEPVDKFAVIGTNPITGEEIKVTDVMGVLQNARHDIEAELRAGEDPDEVVKKYLMEAAQFVGAQVQDLAFQTIADPLNVLPVTGGAVTAGLLEKAAGGRVDLGTKPRGPYDVIKDFGAQVRTRLPAETLGEMPALSRWLAGVNKEGEITAGLAGLYPGETLTSTQLDPTKQVGLFGAGAGGDWFRHVLTLTPEARARTGISMAMDNLGTILNTLEVDEIEPFFHALTNSDMATMKELAGSVAGAAEFYTVLPMLKGWDKLNELAGMWEVSAENRGLLLRMADVLGTDPARLVDDLGKRDGAARTFERIRQLVTKSDDPFARTILDDIEAGRFTAADLEGIGKTFNGADALPWHPGAYKAMVMDSLGEHAANWAKAYFGLKADSGALRLAHTLKGAQSLLLLGFNPNYLINNTVNNVATRAASGVFGFLTPGQMRDWTTRFGITPDRMREGVGMLGEATYKGKADKVISEAMRGKGAMAAVDNIIRAGNEKLGVFANLSKKMEGMESAQAFTIGMKKAWNKMWGRGSGFRQMDAGLVKMLRDIDPSLPELVYRAIEGGMNQKEIEARLMGTAGAMRAHDLVTGAAQQLGMSTSQAMTLLEQAGLLDALDGYLKNANTPEKLDATFRAVNKRAQAWIDAVAGQDMDNLAKHFEARVRGEGANAAFEMVSEAFGKANDRWLEHYMEAGEVAAQMESIGDEFQGQKALLWSDWRRKSIGEWDRVNANTLSAMKGFINGIGLDTAEARRMFSVLSEQYKSWNEAYTFAMKEYDAHYETWKGKFDRSTIDARMTDLESLKARVDAKFEEAFKIEAAKQAQFREALVEQVRRVYGDAVAEATRKAYQQTIDFRAEMVQVLQKFRKEVENLYGADRRAAKAKFYKDIYMWRIVEARRIWEEGAAKVQRMIGGEPPVEGGEGAPVTPPPTAPRGGEGGAAAPESGNVASVPFMVTRDMRQKLYDKGYNKTQVDQMTPTQAWDAINAPVPKTPPPAPPQTGTFGEGSAAVWKIASENGLSGVDQFGNQVFGAKLDVIKFVKKWGGAEGGMIKRFDDITPEIMQKAVDSKKAWEEAQLALPKIEAETPEQKAALIAESEALPEPTKGATDASEKALEKATPPPTPSPLDTIGEGSVYDKVHSRAVNNHIMDLDAAVRDALQYELSVMRSMVAEGEPGTRIFEGYGKDRTVKGIPSSYPDWYGPMKTKKADVVFALDALTRGLDKPEQGLYRNLKGIAAALLNDDWAISERWDWAKAWGLEDEVLYRVDKQIFSVHQDILNAAAEGEYAKVASQFERLTELMATIPDEVRGEFVRTFDAEGKRVPTAETYDQYLSRLWDETSALYEAGTAEHLNAVAELAIRDAQAKSEMVMTREVLREQLTENVTNATPEQIDFALELLDARAETWAKVTGRTAAEWYAQKVAGVVRSDSQAVASSGGLLQDSPLAPVWYSKAEQAITAKMPNRADAKTITGILNGAGVKAEELKWTGLDDWLAEQKGSVSKAEVVQFLQENQVRMEEVTLGNTPNVDGWRAQRAADGNSWLVFDEKGQFINSVSGQANTDKAAIKVASSKGYNPTKFSQYTVPGGENYREVLFTLPMPEDKVPSMTFEQYFKEQPWGERAGRRLSEANPEQLQEYKRLYEQWSERETRQTPTYQSAHWEEPNVLAHVRLDDRVDVDGKRVLFVEEVQSDWHQAGREKGYANVDDQAAAKLNAEKDAILERGVQRNGTLQIRDEDLPRLQEINQELNVLYSEGELTGGRVPQAPFSKTWHEMVMKRVLRMAAEGDYERVAWTTGEMQAARYDLAKQVDAVTWGRNQDGTFDIGALQKDNGIEISIAKQVPLEKVQDYIGKELAKKIAAESPEKFNGTYRGVELAVGGQGMKGFYDQMLPAFMDKYGKKWGAKTGETKITITKEQNVITDGKLNNVYEDASVHSIDVTEAMKSSVLYEGQALFQDAKGGVTFLEDGRAVIHAFEAADISTVAHELGHIFRRDLDAADLKVAEEWAGVKDGKWTRDAEEKFARGFEKYLADGSAPTARLKAVFAKFKEWMLSIYKTITGSGIDVKLTPEMKGVFDRLLAESPLDDVGRVTGDEGARIREMAGDVEMYPQMKAQAEGMEAGVRHAFPTLEEFRSGITVEKNGRGQFVVVQELTDRTIRTTVEGVNSADAAIRKLYETRKASYERELARPASSFYADLRASQEALKNVQPSTFVAWENSKPGDLVAPNMELVKRGILTKNQAGKLAAQVGGKVIADGAKKWAVVLDTASTPVRPTVAVEPAMLFQMADPRMPLGGIDQTSGFMPEGAILDETYAAQIKPLLEAMRAEAGKTERKMNFAELPPEAQAAVNAYVKKVVRQDMPATKLATVRYGEGLRDFALLNYSKKYGFDKYILDPIVPYQFWTTRTGFNTAIRLLDRPAMYANLFRVMRFMSQYERDLPDRLKGKMKVDAPFLPEWMGGSVYIDPLKQMYPLLQFMQPFEQMRKDKNAQVMEAERILQEWAADESYSGREISDAVQTRSGSVWEAALAEASLRRKAEISNPMDFMATILGPAYYLTMPYKLAMGQGAEISQLPITRTAQAIQTATKGTWAEPLGNVVGLLAKPETMAREKLGLSQYGEYGEYYIDRQIANLVAEGLATPEQAKMAMIERQGKVFDMADERVRQELMMRVPGASALYAGTHGGIGEMMRALPTSMFGAGLLPEGELRYRGLKEKWNAAWDAYDAGDTEAIQKFFEDHPEYEVYLMKGQTPDERLRSMLTSQIWDAYMGLDKATRRLVTGQMGPLFEHAFLNKETRSPESLDVETLAFWARLLGAKAPKTEATAPVAEMPAYQMPQLEGFTPETATAINNYYTTKEQNFPFINEIQNLYYGTAQSERSRILSIYPQLREYWDWRRQYIEQNPLAAPFISQEVMDGIRSGELDARLFGLSPDQADRLLGYYNTEYQTPLYTADYYLQNASEITRTQLDQYLAAGIPLGEGALKELRQIWETNGKPLGSFDEWLNEVIFATLGY